MVIERDRGIIDLINIVLTAQNFNVFCYTTEEGALKRILEGSLL